MKIDNHKKSCNKPQVALYENYLFENSILNYLIKI